MENHDLVAHNVTTKQKQYRFLETSWILAIFTFLGMMLVSALLIFKIEKTFDIPNNVLTGISIPALIFIVPLLISRLVSFSKTMVTLNRKEIKVKRSSLIGLPIKSDFLLPYSQIRSFVFQSDQNWYWVKIVDSDGKVYRIWKFGWFNNKEFKAFRDRLTNEINWFNQETAHTGQTDREKEQIKVTENIYQGTIGLILGIVSLIIIIAVPLLLVVFGVPKPSSLGPGLIGLAGAIFTFSKVWNERKNKNAVANKTYNQ